MEDDSGESSCKKRGTDEPTNGRPLKKAKFPWQVKGRYHLKDQDEPADDEPSPPEPEAEEPEAPDRTSADNKFENSLDMLGDYLLRQDFSSLNTLLFGPEPERPEEAPSYPKYSPSARASEGVSNSSQSSAAAGFSSNVKRQLEDQYLKRWQARQIAKGYVDNTINRVLDSWFVAPLPPYPDDGRQLTLDVSGLLDDLTGNDGVENEGILMAISAHGLQQNGPSDPAARRNSQMINKFLADGIYGETSSEWPDRTAPDNTESSDPDNHAWRHFSQPCNCPNAHRINANISNITSIPFHRRNQANIQSSLSESNNTAPAEEPNISLPESKETEPETKEKSEKDETAAPEYEAPNPEEPFEEHFDFIDAAVSYAIQAKGLIPF